MKNSELFFRSIFEQASIGVSIIDSVTNRFKQINQKYCDIIGYSQKEALQLSFVDITHPDDLKADLDNMALLLSEDISTFTIEKRYIKKDGSVIWVNLTVSNLWLEKEKNPELDHIAIVEDITERKLLEKEKEQFFKFFLTSADLMCMADPNGTFLKTNPSFTEVLGYSEEELISKPFVDFVVPEDKQDTIDEMARQISKGATLNFENRYLCKDGSVKWLTWRAVFIKEEGITYATAHDITVRKKIETELIDSEANFKAVVQNSLNLTTLTDVNDNLIFASPQCYEVLGYPGNIFLGKKIPLNIYSEDKELSLQKWQALKTKGEIINHHEYRLIDEDGKIRWISHSAKQVIVDGKVKCYQNSIRNITERKKEEEALVKLNRLYALISQINYLIVRIQDREKLFSEVCNITITHGKFRMSWIGLVNDETQTVIPMAFDGFEDGYLTKIKNISTKDIPKGRGPTGIAVREGKTVICNDIQNDPLMEPWCKEALKRGYRSSISLPIIIRKKVMGAFTLYSDQTNFFSLQEEVELLEKITDNIAFALENNLKEEERKQSENEREKLIKELSDKNNELMQFNYIVSHNLRAPITNLQGLCNLFDFPDLSEDEKFKTIQHIQQAVNNMDVLLKDLHVILSARSGINKNKESINIPNLIISISNALKKQIEECDCLIETNISKEVVEIISVKSYIESILYNLLNNAIKYRADDRKPVIIVSAKREKNHLLVTVSDNGKGIDIEKHGKYIFGLYKRFHFEVEGKGLGLHMTKTQVETLGGSISLKSEVNKGTTFYVIIPFSE